jgi:MFS family permease
MQKFLKWGQLPLQNYKFRRLWLGLLISRLGDQFAIIALLWFILQLTGSGLALASVLLCFSLPGIVTSPLLGHWLDKLQPRLVMGIDNLLRTLFIGAIPALFWLGKLDLWMVYGLALLAGLVEPATNVGVRVMLPDLVEDEQLESGNALFSVSEQFSFLAGPALAGLLVGTLGGPAVLLLDSASFLIMTVILFSLPDITRQPAKTKAEPPAGPTGASQTNFRALFRLKEVWIITGLSFVFFVAYGPLEPALPLYSQDVLKTDASGYGLLWSAFGVGAVLGLLTIPYLAKQPRSGITFAMVAILWGAFLVPLIWLTDLAPAMLFLAIAGCAWAPYTTIEISMLQRLIPVDLRGRVFGARSTLMSAAGPLGFLVGGLLLNILAANLVIGISALACIAAGVAGLLTPAIRNITRSPTLVEPALTGLTPDPD